MGFFNIWCICSFYPTYNTLSRFSKNVLTTHHNSTQLLLQVRVIYHVFRMIENGKITDMNQDSITKKLVRYPTFIIIHFGLFDWKEPEITSKEPIFVSMIDPRVIVHQTITKINILDPYSTGIPYLLFTWLCNNNKFSTLTPTCEVMISSSFLGIYPRGPY